MTHSDVDEAFWQKFRYFRGITQDSPELRDMFKEEVGIYTRMAYAWLSEVCEGCAVLNALERR